MIIGNFQWQQRTRHKLVFQVQGKVSQYAVVATGHVQSSFHLQKVLHTIFSTVIGKGVYVYYEDVFMHAIIFTDFVCIVRQVSKRVLDHDLRCKPSRCEVGVKEIDLLGHVVSAEGIRMSDKIIAAVDAMPFPRLARELQRYFGSMNYMRRHVKCAVILMKPWSS